MDRELLIHPGEILSKEFMEPQGISQNALAMKIGIPTTRINAIVRGKRGISAETAVALGFEFGMSPEFWMNLQSRHDLDCELLRREERVRAS